MGVSSLSSSDIAIRSLPFNSRMAFPELVLVLRVRGADKGNESMAVKRRFDDGDDAFGQDAGLNSCSENEKNDEVISPLKMTSRSKKGTRKTIQLSNKPDEILLTNSRCREKLLKAKMKLLEFKGRGSRMYFD